MNLSRWAFSHRRSILFLLALLTIGGAISAFKLPVGLFPRVNFPRIVVSLNAGDRPAEQMEIAVTRPVEQALRSVPGARHIRSTTSRGSAEISLNFDWGANMPMALQQAESAVNRILPALPPGTSFDARRMDPTVFPVAAYSLTSKAVDLVTLRDVARYQLAPLLSEIDGVARVGVLGGATSEYRVDVDPARLAAYGLTAADVSSAMAQNDFLSGVGNTKGLMVQTNLSASTNLHSLDEFRNLIIRQSGNAMVRLQDVGNVTLGADNYDSAVAFDGQSAVFIGIQVAPTANLLDVVARVREVMPEIQAQLPQGIDGRIVYDSTKFVNSAIHEVVKTLLEALLVGSAGTFFTLFRAVLRLKGSVPPRAPEELVGAAARVIGFDPTAFDWVLARLAGPGRKAARLTEFDPIAERYLGAVERLAEYVDAM